MKPTAIGPASPSKTMHLTTEHTDAHGKDQEFLEAWFKSRLYLRGGWGRRPEGDAPRSEASVLGARSPWRARPQPPSSCHLQDAEIEPCLSR